MKLTGNISIESIIHVVRIDLLTSHVPSGPKWTESGPNGRKRSAGPGWTVQLVLGQQTDFKLNRF